MKIRQLTRKSSFFSFKQTDIKSVVTEIINLKESICTPMESIPAKILKDHYYVIGPNLMTDFNSSIRTGIFPQNQKLADVSPIFKSDVKNFKGNYRPVSIIQNFRETDVIPDR